MLSGGMACLRLEDETIVILPGLIMPANAQLRHLANTSHFGDRRRLTVRAPEPAIK